MMRTKRKMKSKYEIFKEKRKILPKSLVDSFFLRTFAPAIKRIA